MATTSLVQDVEDALRDKRPELADRFARQFDRKQCTSDEGSIKALNKHFRLILAESKLPTQDERGCLRDDIAPGMWLKYFKSHVLPTLVRFNLPPE
jgi:hypothetical protein